MTQSEEGPSPRRIQAVDITLDIIEALQEVGSGGVTELAEAVDHSKSTVHSHLATLEARDIVVREDGRYRLSLRILDIATDVRDHTGNYDVIKAEVDELAAETGEIAQFGIEEYGRVSYLYKSTGDRAVETASRVGTQQPMYSTALGKTILAFLPPSRAREVIESTDYVPLTATTHTGPDELREDLDTIVDRGYGIDDEENFDGLRCIAAPVRSDDTVLGAISLTGPSSRFTDDRLHGDLSDHVRRAANVIELNTKFA